MKRTTAIKTGYNKSFKWAFISFIFIEILFLIIDTKGNFIKGTVPYIVAQYNIYFFGFLILIFGLTYSLGVKAGLDILIDKKKSSSIAWISVGVSVVTIVLYLMLVSCARKGMFDIDGAISMICSVKGLLLLIIIILTWFTTVKQIKSFVAEDK